eukprot:743721-Prymnesium_polylepis.1
MGSSYPTTTPPGRFGRPRGSCITASDSVRAGGTGGISTHAHPSAMARPVTSRHHGAYAISHPLARVGKRLLSRSEKHG